MIGGMVFPLFACFYYWTPMVAKRPLSERLGKWAFWLMFIGFNVSFFPMHIAGLMGMPRRIWTYPDSLGWSDLSFVATIGAFILAVLPNLPGFLVHIKAIDGASVPDALEALYQQAWFVGFALAFLLYLVFRKLSPVKIAA